MSDTIKNWPHVTKELSAQLRNLRGGAPAVMKAFAGIAQSALAPKALDTKTKELIALATRGCDTMRRLHRLSRQGGPRAGRLARGGNRSARHGDLHGRRAIGDVCESRVGSVYAIRSA